MARKYQWRNMRRKRGNTTFVHLAAPNTFAIDGVPACNTTRSDASWVTHTLANVTCKHCLKSAHFAYAKAKGWNESDEGEAATSAAPKAWAVLDRAFKR